VRVPTRARSDALESRHASGYVRWRLLHRLLGCRSNLLPAQGARARQWGGPPDELERSMAVPFVGAAKKPETGYHHRRGCPGAADTTGGTAFRARRGRAIKVIQAETVGWAPSMIDQKDSLAREVDEELRREQLLKLWERYGTYVIAAVVVIIAGIGVYKYVENRRQVAAEAAGARLTLAARDAAKNKDADAEKVLEGIAASGPVGYATLARLRLAGVLREAGKVDEAVAAYDAVAKESGVDPLLSDYAELQAATLRLDSAGWTEMQNRLNPLTAETNAWRFSARELLALAAQKAGKTEEAREEYQHLLGDRGAPPSIVERARIMMAMLTEAKLAKPPPPQAPTAPVAPDAAVPGHAVQGK
jgi:hypothetical protein